MKKKQSEEILALKDKIEEMGGWISEGLRIEALSIPALEEENIFENDEQTFVVFPNGYGASIIRGYGTYGVDEGLFELAAIEIGSETPRDWVFSGNFGFDVIGYLTPEQVLEKLKEIAEYK